MISLHHAIGVIVARNNSGQHVVNSYFSHHETANSVMTISGKVVKVDDEGSLITDIDAKQLSAAPRDASVRIVVDEHETFGIYGTEHGQPPMTLVAILDEAGPLRISLVDDSASAMLGVREGSQVEVQW